MTQDDLRALQLAADSGFRVLPDGFVCAPSVGDTLRDMLIDFYRRAQADMLQDDGK